MRKDIYLIILTGGDKYVLFSDHDQPDLSCSLAVSAVFPESECRGAALQVQQLWVQEVLQGEGVPRGTL